MAHLQSSAVAQITKIVERYKDEPTPLMMILEDVQKEYGYIPLEVQELISDLTDIPVSEIYGVVTFYSFFLFDPKRQVRYWRLPWYSLLCQRCSIDIGQVLRDFEN